MICKENYTLKSSTTLLYTKVKQYSDGRVDVVKRLEIPVHEITIAEVLSTRIGEKELVVYKFQDKVYALEQTFSQLSLTGLEHKCAHCQNSCASKCPKVFDPFPDGKEHDINQLKEKKRIEKYSFLNGFETINIKGEDIFIVTDCKIFKKEVPKENNISWVERQRMLMNIEDLWSMCQ